MKYQGEEKEIKRGKQIRQVFSDILSDLICTYTAGWKKRLLIFFKPFHVIPMFARLWSNETTVVLKSHCRTGQLNQLQSTNSVILAWSRMHSNFGSLVKARSKWATATIIVAFLEYSWCFTNVICISFLVFQRWGIMKVAEVSWHTSAKEVRMA